MVGQGGVVVACGDGEVTPTQGDVMLVIRVMRFLDLACAGAGTHLDVLDEIINGNRVDVSFFPDPIGLYAPPTVYFSLPSTITIESPLFWWFVQPQDIKRAQYFRRGNI